MPENRGRPHELTPAIVAEAQRLANEVEYLEGVAALIGISKRTLYNWMQRGEREQRRRNRGRPANDEESLFVDFMHAIKKGRAESEKRSLDTIRAAADAGVWQAAAWRLERANPERWSLQKSEFARLRKQMRKLLEQEGINPDTLEKKDDGL